MRKPTDKQKLFCEFYVGEAKFNGAEAARLAGYAASRARITACELLSRPNIREYIEARMEALTLSANEVLFRLTSIATGDLGSFLLPDGSIDYEQVISSGQSGLIRKHKKRTTTTSRDGETTTRQQVEIELYSAHDALRDLGRFHKLFTDRKEHAFGSPLKVETIVAVPTE